MNKYFICAKIKNNNGDVTEQFYAQDRRSGGCPYFTDHCNNSEVKGFNTSDSAKKFFKDIHKLTEGKIVVDACYDGTIVGFPYIIKLTTEVVYEMI